MGADCTPRPRQAIDMPMTGARNVGSLRAAPRDTPAPSGFVHHPEGGVLMTATPTMTRPGMTTESPVDDATYNVLMALASKLEAIDTYKKYANDGKNGDLWR